ncbi:hypothetical protein [Burkholderia multivorans]|uniref:hypothetical protein n=1 Tax=Burkholderia multivorans TaxID=87883 RepID=UPI0021BF9DBA|nr:hypothetical protein [Burkholderia multivorans]MDR8760361.1 hypothetical protein [Burkholderia multivorans]MDR8768007.1 hypothetical protein [Burkholderia multivorans]MDR8774761.1 hypothetical protein [Burkholderia multivorans]MDR8793329.1 hypothetical protein [Burkholderia multivorans]MDR8799071.1 hypothetical protein [Burkholderia multivorans]
MTKRDAGIGAEDRAQRQAAAALLIGLLNPGRKKTLKTIAVELELPENKLTDISRKKTRKRWKKNEDTGAKELVETEPGVVDEADFAFIAGKGYDKGRGEIPDQFIFEFGLGQLVDLVQIQRGNGLTDAEEAALDKKAKAEVRATLNNRHKAHELFTIDGLDRIRRGYLPGKRNGSPKQWHKASPEERLAAFDGWLDDIVALGCRVFQRDAWNDWFRTANTSSNMEQSAWHYYDHLEIDGGEICSLPCPPDWMLGVDTEYYGAFDALDSDELLNSLLLVTEGDMPYSVYHARMEQPSRMPRPLNIGDSEPDLEPDWQGDDIGAWLSERQARKAQAEQEANALIGRVSRRRSGGGDL